MIIGSEDLLEKYHIYGETLKIKLKKRFMKYNLKKEKILLALPYMTFLADNFCRLPYICAEKILWNLNCEDIDQLSKMFDLRTETL